MVAQQADHNFGGLAGARVGKSMLLRGQIPVRTGPGADKGRSQQRRPHGIHQAKPDRLNEAVGLVKSAQRRAIQVPLFTAKLVEVDHKDSYLASQLSARSLRKWLNA